MTKFKYNKEKIFRIGRDNLRQLDPQVYEKAAEEVDRGGSNYTCFAIERIARSFGRNTIVHLNAWSAAFDTRASASDVDDKKHPFWNYGLYYEGDKRSANTVKQARMTSLAMMATLVRDAKASRGAKKPKVSHE